MIWKTAKFEIPSPIAQTHAACLGAAERLDWKVRKAKPQRLRFSVPRSVFLYLGKVEIKLQDQGVTTALRVRASNADEGPLARRKLGECLDRLEQAIRLEADALRSPA